MAAAEGDVGAFERLIDLFAPRIHGLVSHLVVDRSRAEPLTRQILVEVWRSAARFDPRDGDARTWIMVLAHRMAVDAVRERDVDRAAEGHGVAGVPDAGGPRATTTLRAVLAPLGVLRRRMLVATYLRGSTCGEAASELDVSVGEIRTGLRESLLELTARRLGRPTQRPTSAPGRVSGA